MNEPITRLTVCSTLLLASIGIALTAATPRVHASEPLSSAELMRIEAKIAEAKQKVGTQQRPTVSGPLLMALRARDEAKIAEAKLVVGAEQEPTARLMLSPKFTAKIAGHTHSI